MQLLNDIGVLMEQLHLIADSKLTRSKRQAIKAKGAHHPVETTNMKRCTERKLSSNNSGNH